MATVEVTFPNGDPSGAYARAASRTLTTWAFEVERRAKNKAPVDTGFTKNSIYTVVPSGHLASDGHEIAKRPPETIPTVNKAGKKVKPGQFADAAGAIGAVFQDVVNSVSSNVAVMGGAEKMGPGASVEFAAEVRVGSEYALYLEMGTIYMEAKPFLGPAAAEVTPKLDGLLRTNLQREGLI